MVIITIIFKTLIKGVSDRSSRSRRTESLQRNKGQDVLDLLCAAIMINLKESIYSI